MKVTVYSTSTCPYCDKAKDFLNKHKIKFREIDVNKDKNAAIEMIKKSGQNGVPVIDAGGKIITGFDEIELKHALKIK